MASLADFHSAYAVNRMTSGAGECALAAFSTSRPSPSGILRSVTTRSNTSSASRAAADVAPSASITRWPRLRRSSARVVRAEGSSSTTRRCAMSGGRRQREEQGHPRALADLGVDLDASPVRALDALRDRQAEPAAVRLARVERLEDAGQVLGRDAGAGVADRERDVAVAAIDLE